MSYNRFNKILIVDSIPKGQENTAENLHSAITEQLKVFPDSPCLELVRVESANEFLRLISESAALAKSDDVYPMLHIECHGDEDGFQFADGSLLDWPELKTPLETLNQAMRLNLIIVAAACVGAAIAKVIDMGNRAPFWGVIGPIKSVSPSELEEPFKALYLTLIETKSPEKAIEAFEKKAGDLYWRTTAQGLFIKGWRHYREVYCNPETLEIRGERMQQKARHLSKQDCINRLLSHEPVAFERYRRAFFMCDLFPEHVERFPINYE